MGKVWLTIWAVTWLFLAMNITLFIINVVQGDWDMIPWNVIGAAGCIIGILFLLESRRDMKRAERLRESMRAMQEKRWWDGP